MEFIIGIIVGYSCSYLIKNTSLLRNNFIQKIQLQASFLEFKTYRHKKKKPRITHKDRVLFGLLYSISPSILEYITFKPHTLIKWHRDMVKNFWKGITKSNKKKIGRPPIPDDIRQIVLQVAQDNTSYKHKKIAEIMNNQFNIKISATSIKNILKSYNHPIPPQNQSLKTFLNNHKDYIVSMDFKVAFDWRAKPLFILNIIDHERREILLSRSTYSPHLEWVTQQLKEAFAFSTKKKYLLMDNDTTFRALKKSITKILNITPIYTAYKSPWQNGIVERFNKTLKYELLNHIIPLDDKHLNNLLHEYTLYYNHGRPHRFNNGAVPVDSNHNKREGEIFKIGNNQIERISWLNGLHYCM